MMSSDLFLLDGPFLSEPFSPLTDSLFPLDHILQENYINEETPFDEIDQFASTLLSSSSPPSHQMANLTLSQTPNLGNPSISSHGYADFSALEVKTEEPQVPFSSVCNIYNNSFPPSYGGSRENMVKMMQKSFNSSKGFEVEPRFLFQPRLDSLMESSNFHPQALSSPENSFSSGQMRRACSTGDLQGIKTMQRLLSRSPLATQSSLTEANSKAARCSAQERKERIHKYRVKRTHRNFNKTIKYACRKRLADNRPRIRGRFVRNDETGENSKTVIFCRYEDAHDPWMERFREEGDEGCCVPTKFQ